MITAIKSAVLFHASLHSLRGAAWKAQVRWGDAGPGSATAHGGHCCLAISPLILPAWPSAGQPPTGPAFLTDIAHATGLHLPQKLLWEALPAPQADTGHPTGTPCHTRGTPTPTLPCLSQPSTNAQQKPAAHSPHTCLWFWLTSSQKKAFTLSSLHFSNTLCQPSPRFRPLLGRWHSDKSKTVTSGVMVTDTQIQSSHLQHNVSGGKAQSSASAGCSLDLVGRPGHLLADMRQLEN